MPTQGRYIGRASRTEPEGCQLSEKHRPGSSAPAAGWSWLVHAFSASGAALALFALAAVEQGRWHLAMTLLAVAMVIDGVDGSLARWVRVKERTPRIDGDSLDLVIDYLTYVFVPALFIWRAELVPGSLGPGLAAGILVSSLYVFARTDMKTADWYFRGFPALWNLVAFYLFVLATPPWAGAVVVAALIVMTFAPVHFVHPFRVRDYGRWLPVLTLVWAATTVPLLSGTLGRLRELCVVASLATAAALVGLGLWRTFRGQLPPTGSRT
jgi:phosphatidylcholine synthase